MQLDTTDLGDRFRTSFSEIFLTFIPRLLLSVVIIFAGYLLAKMLERIVERLLRRFEFDRILEWAGVTEVVERSGRHLNPPRVLAKLMFWLVMFAVILLAARPLGMDVLAKAVSTLVSYVPSVIAAVVIMLVGSVLGGFVEGLITASAGAIHGGRSLARTGRAGVILLSVFMALQELGIATDIVTTAFAILFGAIALAMALAFGLGNRDLAGEVTREWYERYKQERDEARAREQEEEARLDSDPDYGGANKEGPVPPHWSPAQHPPAPPKPSSASPVAPLHQAPYPPEPDLQPPTECEPKSA